MNKKPFYFSIDFEDFSHDLKRSMGDPDPSSNEEALWKSYYKIQEISEQFLGGKKITFFVTGVLARKNPEVVKRIFDDGHEVACHYNFHDNIYLSNRKEFSNELDVAITAIAKIIGEKPLGFRAPNFSINADNIWAYEELAIRFKYDSSYRTSSDINDIVEKRKFIFDGNELYEFFIYGMPILGESFKIRCGGTFFRLFPSELTIKSMEQSFNLGHVPLLYMHPYELTDDFWVPWKDLKYISFNKRFINWARQYQWCKLGHGSVEKKLIDVCRYFEHQGPMKQLIEELF